MAYSPDVARVQRAGDIVVAIFRGRAHRARPAIPGTRGACFSSLTESVSADGRGENAAALGTIWAAAAVTRTDAAEGDTFGGAVAYIFGAHGYLCWEVPHIHLLRKKEDDQKRCSEEKQQRCRSGVSWPRRGIFLCQIDFPFIYASPRKLFLSLYPKNRSSGTLRRLRNP